MTFEEAHLNGKNGLVTRRNLSEDDLIIRLNSYFCKDEIDDIINSSKNLDCWTDGNIAIVFLSHNSTFIVIADGNYMDLIKQ